MNSLFIFGVVIVIGGGVYFTHKGKKPIKSHEEKGTPKEVIIEENETIKSISEPTFLEDFGRIADRFEGLYQELYEVTQNKREYVEKELHSLLFEWEQKIRFSKVTSVQNTWNSLVSNYLHINRFEDISQKNITDLRGFLAKWYNMVMEVGIKRDDRTAIKVINFSIHQYYTLDNIYNIGEEIKIDKPCWILNGKCLEKGIASVQKSL